MNPRRTVATTATCLSIALAPACAAYEADVHFGLTRWLAREAGFTSSQASAIAVGSFRADSGLIATMELHLEHACVGSFPEAAADVQRRHYPTARAVPAPPKDRAVVAGSAAARQALAEVLPHVAGKEGLMLSKFGEALHPLQDSWSYAGVPGNVEPGAGIRCDAANASGHPAARSGAHPHGAALTHTHPADAVAMAAATYQALVAYPPVAGASRAAAVWSHLAPEVERFARARTKTEKRAWFVRQGVEDTGFLRDTTLPDGPKPGPLEFAGRLLPALKSAASSQHDAADDIKAFFDGFFARWLGPEPVDAVAAALGATSTPARQRELAARLKLWKLRDHGSAAVLAHARAPLGAAQLQQVDRLARAPGAYVQVAELHQAFFPLLPKSKYAPPLMPYVVRDLPPAADGRDRRIAILRLRHAPYDSLGLVAERGGAGWRLTDIAAAVDQ